MEIVPVPAFSDNYIWLVHDEASGETAVVDPGDAAPVLAEAERRGWTIDHIWNTHWHPDHTGGNEAIKEATGCSIIAPDEARRVSQVDRVVSEGDRVTVAGADAIVWNIPAHTAGHIAYYFEDEGMIFVGDTMFAMGCGRLFEGTAAQMFANLQRIAALPGDVRIYCGHEYTLANARFAAHVEPENAAVADRLANVEAMRERGEITLPTTVAQERETNPFVRSTKVEEFARRRAEKDSFRS
jgi:hydroxyacylglutathione hydrolase